MAHTNWKLIAERTGLPVSTIKAALAEVKDAVKLRLILRTLAQRSDGRGSRQYEREVPNAPDPTTLNPDLKSGDEDEDGEGMWDLMRQNYMFNTSNSSTTGDDDNEDR